MAGESNDIVQDWMREFDKIAREQSGQNNPMGPAMISYGKGKVNISEFLKLKLEELKAANEIQKTVPPNE